ncbi:MAG: 50S ribosomal protein L17 [Sphingobacteriales bacterium]|nr:50S ribosomal protein L17 [Sphingobacteriales bacterium]MBP8192656.1 50S ribosomal protein L17 [Chitinophagales bacterium]
MRHGNKINHLGRKYGHRAALLKNLSSALFMHKRIETTVAKAKELRGYVEPLVTKAKDNTTHSRRDVFSYLQDKYATKELFDVIAPKVGNRPGGYTRIVRLGQRQGDAAEMAIMELVDFNEVYKPKAAAAAEPKKKTRRAGAAKKAETAKEVVEEKAAEVEEVKDTVEDVTPTEEKTEE